MDEGLRIDAFHKVGVGTSGAGLFFVNASVPHGKNDDGAGGAGLADLANEAEVVLAVHEHVKEEEIGTELGDLGEDLPTLLGLADDGEGCGGVVLQELDEPDPDEVVVIC